MAPIKFEEKIKEKLAKRRIEPSQNSWGRLSQKLDDQDKSSNKSIVWWLGIAASLVGVFLISTLFFNNNEGDIVLPTVVETPINDVPKIEEEGAEINVIAEYEKKSVKENMASSDKSEQNFVKQKRINEATNSNRNAQKSGVVAYNAIENKNDKNRDVINSVPIIEKSNNQGIVAQVKDFEEEKYLVTDAEITSLLLSAQSDLEISQNAKDTNFAVDSNSLLQDVEADLDQSFRDKMFNTLISGYNTIRLAVTERND